MTKIPAGLERLLPFALTGVVAAGLGFLPDDATRLGWFVDRAAPIVVAAMLLAGVAGVAVLRSALRGPDAGAHAREALVALAVAAALVVALRTLVPVTVRTEVDESFLVGVSYGLHLDGAPVVPTDAVFGARGIEPLQVQVDVRGIAFPLLVAAVHAVRGFDADNALALNGVLSALALLALYVLARQLLRPAAALSALFLFCAFPAVAMSVASGAFEPVNLLLVLAVTTLALRVRRDDAGPALPALLLAVPVLAQGRYESVLLGACVLLAALPYVARARSHLPAAVLALVPLLLLPFAWQRAKQLQHDPAQIGADVAFGADILFGNVVHAVEFLLQPSAVNPAGPLVLAAAVIGVAGALRVSSVRPWRDPVLVALALGYAAMAGVILAYVWGDARQAYSLRYSLVFLAVLAIAGAEGLQALFTRLRYGSGGALLVAGAALLGAAPTIARDVLWNNQFAAPSLRAALSYVRTVAPRCRPLFATPVGIHYVVRGYDGVAIAELMRDWGRFRERARQGLAGPVLAVGMYDAKGIPFASSFPPPDFTVRRIFDAPAGSGRVEVFTVDRADAPLPPPTVECAALVPGSARPVE